MKSFISWIYGFALALGGPGLFAVAFLDSSFVSLPQINDILVVLMVTQNKAWMPYYAAMATLGSVAGCYAIYYLADKGGKAFLRKRYAQVTSNARSRCTGATVSWRVVPALLPPPAPFKLFVLTAGVAEVPPVKFVVAIAVARGVRYFALGMLAIWYGDLAVELMRTRGRDVAFLLAGLIVVAAVGWWWLNRRRP